MASEVVCVVLISCLAITSGFKLNAARWRREDQMDRFISYISNNGDVEADQRVVVTETEAAFQMIDGMQAVFDYQQHLLTLRRTPKDGNCLVVSYKPTISLDFIKEMIDSHSKFPMPKRVHKIRLEKSHDRSPIQLSPLSTETCAGADIIRMEEKQAKHVPVFYRVRIPLRPKRESSWGDVVAIDSVIVITL